MFKKILNLFKSENLWINILSSLIGLIIISVFTFLIGLLKGFDLISSIKWTVNLFSFKINLFFILLIIIFVIVYIKWKNKQLLTYIKKTYFTKDEIIQKLEKKLNYIDFECFEDIYDYRRLKNHPWHDIYVNKNDDISSFKSMVYFGITKHNPYKIDNGIQGLIKELKGLDFITGDMKTEITNLLKDCYPDKFDCYKEELIQLLNEIRTI